MAGLLQHVRRNLVAYLALFLALSSTGYAASSALLPRNSVGSAQVVNGSLLKADLNKKTLAKLRGPRGFTGPPGITVVTTVDSAAAPMCAFGSGGCEVAGPYASCPAGSAVVGGGWQSDSPQLIVPYAKHPTDGGQNYSVIAINFDTSPHTISAQAICATRPTTKATSASKVANSASFRKALDNAREQVGRRRK